MKEQTYLPDERAPRTEEQIAEQKAAHKKAANEKRAAEEAGRLADDEAFQEGKRQAED